MQFLKKKMEKDDLNRNLIAQKKSLSKMSTALIPASASVAKIGTKSGRRQLLFELTCRRLKSNLLTKNLLQTKSSKYEDHLGNFINSKIH
jgi:hypothetical protein